MKGKSHAEVDEHSPAWTRGQPAISWATKSSSTGITQTSFTRRNASPKSAK